MDSANCSQRLDSSSPAPSAPYLVASATAPSAPVDLEHLEFQLGLVLQLKQRVEPEPDTDTHARGEQH